MLHIELTEYYGKITIRKRTVEKNYGRRKIFIDATEITAENAVEKSARHGKLFRPTQKRIALLANIQSYKVSQTKANWIPRLL